MKRGQFNETAERRSIAAKYLLRVSCACGWSGTQADLQPMPKSKRRSCPVCWSVFTRTQELHAEVQS